MWMPAGSTSCIVRKGDSLAVSFQARPGVVITGGSQNLDFMNDPVQDMKVTTAAAPSNPITPVTYTGFQFAPKQDYYQSFQGGVLAKLAVFAFDASRPSQNRSDGVLGMYKTASCRTTIELQLASPPPNVTVGSDQLYSDARPQAMGNVQHSKTTAIVVPCVIGGFVCAMILGCLTLGLAKKGPATLPK
ncbi:g12886 [Coccomyxa viridis]|uniref:G12886 protein n=1 Tax=Coccomyxa viridis TaxID=1274662 RepID=A0ABP1GG45_9CHLO